MSTILLAFAIAIGVVIIPSIFYFKLGWFKFFYHDVMGWHVPSDEIQVKGINFCSKCKYCGKDIMQDSQGNWFEV